MENVEYRDLFYTVSIIKQALNTAYKIHKDQKEDGVDIPFIFHPYRVAEMYLKENIGKEKNKNRLYECAIIALLHDTIKQSMNDTKLWCNNYGYSKQCIRDMMIETIEIKKKEFKENFGEKVSNAVDVLTQRYEDNWDEYIDKVCQNEYATIVKMYDIRDNMEYSMNKEFPQEYKRAQYAVCLNTLSILRKARDEFDKQRLGINGDE